jgi:hypothetical protein
MKLACVVAAANLLLGLLCQPAALAQQTAPLLPDISIGIFEHESGSLEPAVEIAPGDSISPEAVRMTETRYIPMLLRYRIEATGHFGAVRVLPLLDNGAEVMIEGRILESSATQLRLALRAVDSTGRIWLEQEYAGSAISSESLNAEELIQDDFNSVYSEIVRDLEAALAPLDPAQRDEIRTLSLLRYGLGLVPQSFADYIGETPEGRMTVRRLPARDDPLLTRIEAIREREYLFIDVVDAEYSRFYADIKPVYDMWREYRREQADTAISRTEREATETSQFARGSYYALQENYNNYRWAKLQELYLDELSEGFANETEPTEIELSDSLYRLTGTLEQQYREWRTILTELYLLETR